MSCTDVAKVTGQHILFLGVGTQTWALSQFTEAAQFARAHGIDSLLVKVSDGTYKWYGGLNGYRQIKAVIEAEGVGVIPYTYSYGNTYGALDSEIDILISYMQDSGVVCADMESEWNGQVGWASHLTSRMSTLQGVFLVSTWGDPSLQNWTGVIQALAPCVDAFMPQQYNNYLSTFWWQFAAAGASCLQPTLDMTQDFGSNNPVSIAADAYSQGHTAISIWYYETSAANPGLLDQVLSAFPKTGGNIMTIPSGWTDDGTTLTAPNKIPVTLGFRDHVLANNWDPDNWPLETEQHFTAIELSNPSLGDGQAQTFRWKRLEYTPKTGVFEGWIGQELVWYQKDVKALNAQIATLQGVNDQLKSLLASSNLGQIGALGKQIQDDIALIMKLVQVQ